MGIEIRKLQPEDVDSAIDSFSSYNKKRQMFENFISDQEAGLRISFSAIVNGTFVGYANLIWESNYIPFKAHNIPEINNMHVLDQHQGTGIGTALIGAAENEARSQGCFIIGIGVGLTPGYAKARRLFPYLDYVSDNRGDHEDDYDGCTYFTKQLTSPELKSLSIK